ncbi:MAG: OmpA family protein [Flavobacteriaceae bacterium]|jgi:ompA/motB domain protein|nr:OmpA family protein [Flavobacteriaceae bacterium]
MKRQFLAFVMAILFSLGVNAQDYNKWSIDAGAGVSILSSSGLSEGYNTPFPNLWTMNGGIRYMFNNKFGVRVGGGFDQLNQAGNSPKFATRIWNVNVQGVANLGRVLAFEEFTKNIGLLGHVGVGYGYMTSKNFRGVDNLGIITFGLTPQVRLSDRVTLLLSGTFNWYLTQQYTFNGENLTKDVNMTPMRHVNFQGLNFTATAGLQIALGKKRVHADWYGIKREDKDDDKKVAQNEKTVNNHITRGGSDVAANGQRIENDKNALANNNVNNANDSDDEGDVNNSNIASNQNTTTNNIIVESVDPAKELIEKGYVNAYFGFDSSEPQDGSLWAVGFVANYLKQNPDAKLNIIGYTDQMGNAGYNEKLSKKRADAVKQLLVEMGVDTSRLASEGKGIDKGAKSSSAGARRLVRRVSFELTNESGNKDSHIASK